MGHDSFTPLGSCRRTTSCPWQALGLINRYTRSAPHIPSTAPVLLPPKIGATRAVQRATQGPPSRAACTIQSAFRRTRLRRSRRPTTGSTQSAPIIEDQEGGGGEADVAEVAHVAGVGEGGDRGDQDDRSSRGRAGPSKLEPCDPCDGLSPRGGVETARESDDPGTPEETREHQPEIRCDDPSEIGGAPSLASEEAEGGGRDPSLPRGDGESDGGGQNPVVAGPQESGECDVTRRDAFRAESAAAEEPPPTPSSAEIPPVLPLPPEEQFVAGAAVEALSLLEPTLQYYVAKQRYLEAQERAHGARATIIQASTRLHGAGFRVASSELGRSRLASCILSWETREHVSRDRATQMKGDRAVKTTQLVSTPNCASSFTSSESWHLLASAKSAEGTPRSHMVWHSAGLGEASSTIGRVRSPRQGPWPSPSQTRKLGNKATVSNYGDFSLLLSSLPPLLSCASPSPSSVRARPGIDWMLSGSRRRSSDGCIYGEIRRP